MKKNTHWRKKLPAMKFFFPIGDLSEVSGDPLKSQRGVALMVAVMIISIMMMFAAEFIVSSTVNLARATALRDNVRAEYVAKSAANWAIWLNLFDYGLSLQLKADKSGAGAAMAEGIGSIWNKLDEAFPFDTPTDVGDIAKFSAAMGLSQLMDSKVLELIESLGGSMGVKVEDESSRINLNVCATNQKTLCDSVLMQVEALLSCTDVEADFMKKNDLKPSEIARRIRDWVDENPSAEGSGYSDENDPYQKRTPALKAKNSSLDSVNDLLLVDGWDRELHAYFSPYLTVWPYVNDGEAAKSKESAKLNINSMQPEALKCLFARELVDGDAKIKFVKKYHEMIEKNGKIASADKDIKERLNELFGYSAEGAEKEKGSWMTTNSSTFRVKTKGIVGEQTRTLEYVMQRLNKVQFAARTSDTSKSQSPWSLLFYRMY
jgi:type II secretory pathway component PulK